MAARIRQGECGIASWLARRPVALGYLESDHSTQRLEYLGAPCRLARQVKELWRAPQNPLVRDTATDPTGIPRTKRHTPVHVLCVLKARETVVSSVDAYELGFRVFPGSARG